MTDRQPPKLDSFEAMTNDEKAAAIRAELYATHKARGTLGFYYSFYPEDRPKYLSRPQGRENEGRERD